jgi:hypothetical protein
VLAKHTRHLNLVDILAVRVDRMQRNFEPMRKQVKAWKGTRLPDESAKLVIYRAFVEGELDAPKHLARRVHDLYFNPQVEEFAPRTTWSLSNSFTSAFKELDPIPQFKATAKLAPFLKHKWLGNNHNGSPARLAVRRASDREKPFLPFIARQPAEWAWLE